MHQYFGAKKKKSEVIFRGVEAVVYAALLPPDTGVRGEYLWHDKTLVTGSTGQFLLSCDRAFGCNSTP